MVTTACAYPKKTASFLESYSRLWRMYTNPAFIFEENVRLFDSKKTMDKAFLSIKPFIEKLKDKWVYRDIRFRLISPKDGDKEYATSIQKALWAYIVSWLWNTVNEDWVTTKPWFENLKPSDKNAWDVALYNDLSPTEKAFVRDLASSLNSFVQVFKDSWNKNLATLIRWCINNWILNENLSVTSKKPSWKWTGLWNLMWLYSTSWSWKNNVLWLLWLYDWNENIKYSLSDENWESEDFAIADLYSPNDERLIKMFWLLFWSDWNIPVNQNTQSYRYAIKLFMKATEIDKQKWWGRKIINSIMKVSAMWKLSAYFLNLMAWACTWISCLYTWFLNVMSYHNINSKKKLNNYLERLWLKTDHFKFKDDYKWRLKERAQNRFWTWNVDLFFDDVSRKKSRVDNAAFNWIMMWPANILWDTIWRWSQQRIAMDFALQKLWFVWDIDSYLYEDWPDWTRVPSMDRFVLLLDTYTQKLAEISWFPQIEWWSQLLWRNLDWSLFKEAVWTALSMLHFLTQWATAYVNNTYRILAWWVVNYVYAPLKSKKEWVSTEEYIDNAYKWPGWDRLIRRHARSVERWEYVMPWEHAQALVSKKEFWREIMRVLSWIRYAYRFWNIACRDWDTWELNLQCAMKNFLNVVYLPAQAAQMAHPLIQSFLKTIKDCIKYIPHFKDESLWVKDSHVVEESVVTNFLKPMLKAFYIVDIAWSTAEKMIYNDDDFIWALFDSLVDSTDAMLYYTADEISSRIYNYWAYWPKSYLNNDTSLFWQPNELRDSMSDLSRIKAIESVANEWIRWKIWNINSVTRWFLIPIFNMFRDEDNQLSNASWLFESQKADKMLLDYNSDEWIFEMKHWRFTPEMLRDADFMQYTWTNIMSDFQPYWADFNKWIRDNKYNTDEIMYMENRLKEDMEKTKNANPWLSDLEIFDVALKDYLWSNPTYDMFKDAIQEYYDNWESEKWAFTDYLANAANYEETAWVKWLALMAEYMKRVAMENAGIQYSSKQTAEEKAIIKWIENEVAWILWPYLRLADRRQYANLEWRRFIQEHPEYKDYDPFKNLIDKNWEWNVNWDVKETWVLWTALWANNLAQTELILWNTNWYELVNVFTEKFWSPFDEKWNFDEVKAAQMIDWVIFLADALEDAWKSKADIALILAPTLTKHIKLWDYALTEDTDQNKRLRELLWEEWIDQIRWLLYDTYSWITDLPELLDLLNDEKVYDKIVWEGNNKHKKWGSLYYWNNTRKNYDYYKEPANIFKSWWSKNLSKLANWYGNSWKRNYAWSYTPREFYFLNQRSYRNSINSARIAPDIPLTIWGFSQTTVKSKNPVSWYTTNIKPWESKPTAKFGKSKSIVWWGMTRWSLTHYKA